MERTMNWVGIAGGVSTLILITISMFVPWWFFSVGNPAFAEAKFSPVNLAFSILGSPLTIPLIWALNIATLLSLAAGGIIMLIYSVWPTKSYSKRLLGFSYNKPLVAVVLFAVELFALSIMANAAVGINVPIVGSAVVQIPESLTQGMGVSVLVSANLVWPFYFAIVVAALCIAARIYHRKIEKTTKI